MKSWKTTLAGIGAAVALVANQLLTAGTMDAKTWITAIFMAALGVVAKDFNTTGGKIQQ
jgi:hypothetical protein